MEKLGGGGAVGWGWMDVGVWNDEDGRAGELLEGPTASSTLHGVASGLRSSPPPSPTGAWEREGAPALGAWG